MRAPIVSVLITAYNRERYIKAAIMSVLSSTLENFELLIIDDCSTDSTADIAKSFLEKDPRVKVVVNSSNKGQFENRNYAVKLAKGKYVKFLDSDDIIYSYSLGAMVSALELFPDAGFAIQYEIDQPNKPFPFELDSVDAYRLHFLNGGFLFPGPSAVLFKKAVLDEFHFVDKFGSVGDTHLVLQIAAQYRVVALPRDLIYWRIHDEQVSEEQRSAGKIYYERYLMNQDILESPKVPLDKKESLKILNRYRRLLCRNVLKYSLKRFDFSVLYNCKINAKLHWYDFVDALIPNRLIDL